VYTFFLGHSVLSAQRISMKFRACGWIKICRVNLNIFGNRTLQTTF